MARAPTDRPTPGPQRVPLVLASTSPYRAQALARLGWAFETAAPRVDEAAGIFSSLPPRERSLALARAKAEAVRRERPQAHVIGSDQVCAQGDRILHKPGSPERARDTLMRLAGGSHTLWTSVVVLSPEASAFEHTDQSTLHMRALEGDEITRYLASDEPWDCAGAYKIESGGIRLFDRVESRDWNAIVGLPLLALSSFFATLSVPPDAGIDGIATS